MSLRLSSLCGTKAFYFVDQYLWTVIRYIHNNPVKAGITKLPEEYRFSSIHEYYGQKSYNDRLLETGLILELFDREHKKAMEEFGKFMLYDSNDQYSTAAQDEKSLGICRGYGRCVEGG